MDIALGRDVITIAEVRRVARDGGTATLDEAASQHMRKAQAMLQEWLQADRPVYGLTRGLGNRASVAVPFQERSGFSKGMVKTRASGAGGYFDGEVVRAALFVRTATLAPRTGRPCSRAHPVSPASPAVAALHAFVRRHVAFLDQDRSTTEDLASLSAALRDGSALRYVEEGLASLEMCR